MVWGKGELPYQSSSCPHLAAQGQELLKERVPGWWWGAPHAEIAVSLKLVMPWSDRRYPGWLKSSSVPESVCSCPLEAVPHLCMMEQNVSWPLSGHHVISFST